MTVKNHINRSLRSIAVFLMLSGAAATASAAEGDWALTANNMGAWHSVHSSVTLQDGRVAVIGSYEYSPYIGTPGPQEGEGGYIEIYAPDTGQWEVPLWPCDSDTTCRNAKSNFANTATVLDDGNVLIAGGTYDGGHGTSRSWLFDPATGTLSDTATGPRRLV